MLAVTMLAGLTLVACRSEPGPHRVALDTVQAMDSLPQGQRDCMTEKIEEDYSEEEIEAIASANDDVDFSGQSVDQMKKNSGSEAWVQFVDDLSECADRENWGSTEGSTPTDDTTGSETADTSGTETTDGE